MSFKHLFWLLGVILLAVLAAGMFYGCGSVVEQLTATTTTVASDSSTTTTSTTSTSSTTTSTTAAAATTSTSTTTTSTNLVGTTVPGSPTTTLPFGLSSSAFSSGGSLPARFASTDMSGGQNISPPLQWTGPPAGTKAYAIAIVDSSASNFVHWHVINIPSTETSLAENASASGLPAGSSQSYNQYLTAGYGGPAPPSGETHSYTIRLYALSGTLEVMVGFVSDSSFTSSINTKKISEVTMSGTYFGTN